MDGSCMLVVADGLVGDCRAISWMLRSDIHEEAFVKTGARRLRDFPDIHSASAAEAARHERVCGCPHSHQRRRSAPCRTPGCNLNPALDLDVEPSSDRSNAPATIPGNRERLAGLQRP